MGKWWVISLTFVLLLSMLPAAALARSDLDRELTVVFRSGAMPAGARQQLEKAGVKVERIVDAVGVVQVKGKASLIPLLQKLPGVQYVAPSLTWKLQVEQALQLEQNRSTFAAPGDLYTAYQWDIQQVTENGASWQLDKGTHRTVVGIIDTGVFAEHQDLKGNFLGGRNFVPAGANGDRGEKGDPNDVADRVGHGSHVAGSIAGNGRIYGVGPGLGFRSYRVFGTENGAQTSWITAAMVAAADDGVDVISMSIGGYDVMGKVTWTDPATGVTYDLGDDHADLAAWKRAFAYVSDHNVVLVAAAGNEGIDAGNPREVISYLNSTYGAEGYTFAGLGFEVPAGIRGAVAVSATGPDQSLASYSNFGRHFITVAAPGGDVTRYPIGDWFTDMCLSAYMDEGDGSSQYVWMAGTSMATPKAAAVVAVYIDQFRAKHGRAPEAEESVAQLHSGTTHLGKGSNDAAYGFGLVDAFKMLSTNEE